MKSKIIALALIALTIALVAFYPSYQGIGATPSINLSQVEALPNERSQIEVVFVLDTTGSMSGLIQAAKEKIWSIATSMASANPAPLIRMGLVAYRDRGDAYITRVLDLSEDLDSMYATLMDFQARGGGDGPESVNQALHDAVHKVSWSQNKQIYKVVFLVGDAPPHMDYQDDVKYPQTLSTALNMGIVINAIQCGQNVSTSQSWEKIARLGKGDYFQVEQEGSAVAIATPFDDRLADLSVKLDETRLYYGTAEEKQKQRIKLDATEKLHAASSIESRARRATFNASQSGRMNFLGEGELVDDIVSGRADLSTIERDQLPEPMKVLAPAEQRALITETAKRRDGLQKQIKELARQRSEFIQKKVEELGGAKHSLDHKIYNTVRQQAGKMGLHYEVDALTY